jgi:hypothetical protein
MLERNAIIEERRKYTQEIDAVLKTTSTLNSLKKAWPEISSIIAKFEDLYEPEIGSSIALVTTKLNKALDLPPEKVKKAA